MQQAPVVPTLPPPAFRLPARLDGLRTLVYNLYPTWHPDARQLFSRIDPALWSRYRNPISILLSHQGWADLLDNPAFMAEYEMVLHDFERYMADGTGHWFARRHLNDLDGPIAYFCAEYGLSETLGIYSGGLGVLAGDHTKTASDMALPFVAVGLFYRRGYFRQTIDADGHQEHAYPDYDPLRLPLLRVASAEGGALQVPVDLPGRTVWCAVWLAQVGRVPLLLLDTDVADNAPEDRPITGILYVRGREMRFCQEMVLGVGGVRALRALAIRPAVWHLNEGHSAMMLVERARELVAQGLPLDDALTAVRRDAVFTIHTPVSAGNERFDANLVRRVASPLSGDDGVDLERILELGRGVDGTGGEFDMTAFCLRLTNGANAVSMLHSQTANAMWRPILDHPILGITNGIHVPSWVGRPVRSLYQEHGGDLDDLDADVRGHRFWDSMDQVPDRQLWSAHSRQKLELAHFVRGRLLRQLARHGESPDELRAIGQVMDPNALTIGFARRFATYKRASLLFTDEERLARLLWNPERPVQIVFAGKAHPADRPGQNVIQDIWGRSQSPRLRGRVFIIEDYDMRVARFLIQGVDVWLNNPRRPLEASGTSGMKAAVNGVVNLSVLDGWWDEGWTGANGWAIGGRDTTGDEGAQDWADAEELYRILEQEVVPRYYERDRDGIPAAWLETCRASIRTTVWRFSTTRMLEEYTEQLYLPAARNSRRRRRPGRARGARPVAAGARADGGAGVTASEHSTETAPQARDQA
ncbi:MAG: alpha-glucan family phosphorylase [Candidatus Limnocylindrales bacterium]|jgi:starch phosphorylase